MLSQQDRYWTVELDLSHSYSKGIENRFYIAGHRYKRTRMVYSTVLKVLHTLRHEDFTRPAVVFKRGSITDRVTAM